VDFNKFFMKRNIKNILGGLLGLALFLYFLPQNFKELSNTWEYMKQVPKSIIFVILAITILYFLQKIPFFKDVQLNDSRGLFSGNKRSEVSKRNFFPTLIYFIIFFAFVVGFISIIFDGMD